MAGESGCAGVIVLPSFMHAQALVFTNITFQACTCKLTGVLGGESATMFVLLFSLQLFPSLQNSPAFWPYLLQEDRYALSRPTCCLFQTLACCWCVCFGLLMSSTFMLLNFDSSFTQIASCWCVDLSFLNSK